MQWCTPTCRVSITNSTFGTQPIAAPLSYKYFSECFLAEFALFGIHPIQSVTLQLQTVNRWQEATVMNFSSCLGSWQADCFDLKVWGGLDGYWRDDHRDTAQVSPCWNGRVRLSRCDIWANDPWPRLCIQLGGCVCVCVNIKAPHKQLWMQWKRQGSGLRRVSLKQIEKFCF